MASWFRGQQQANAASAAGHKRRRSDEAEQAKLEDTEELYGLFPLHTPEVGVADPIEYVGVPRLIRYLILTVVAL